MMLPSQLPLLDALEEKILAQLELELADDHGVAMPAEDHPVAFEPAMEERRRERSPGGR